MSVTVLQPLKAVTAAPSAQNNRFISNGIGYPKFFSRFRAVIRISIAGKSACSESQRAVGPRATSNRLEMQSSYRNVVDRNDRDVIYGFRCVLATQPGSEIENK
jgi:hypothetical protein